ncbi:MAG: hypothetical protein ACJ716_12405 [Marmoricola sp.]
MVLVELGIVTVGIVELTNADIYSAAIWFFGGQGVFLIFALGSFALCLHYKVAYYRGSLRDYLRERHATPPE